ncbi:16S rRNA (guanine(527)-N(7))-methyltransferase RsmG [Jatrophihabitans telluris]|uniref:Ribosomal RNA small subunit methyltransferase G n=1 Tax=Jatrophihabitans telluris TaxID=2038343 RepID=A0ABY4QY94_9ACTN|nr:16S rRNA (guanine(527)-N(7))-methyltransferase RsmG [Jatrophihabitans telluris]UQX88549.1 16S rRNA (guanine(527)-N(7))-methyltransferase RsmG [Jatrophihabitans telluris]
MSTGEPQTPGPAIVPVPGSGRAPASDDPPVTSLTTVSAPLAGPPPAAANARYAGRVDLLARYAQWLADAGTVRGLIGPREVPRLWERHLLNSTVLEELIPPGSRLVDIGSGAGLPGLAVACVRPDLRVDLVESLQRRTDFLNEVVAALDLSDRVRVVRGRAEDKAVIDTVGSAEFVTARAVAPLDRLASWAMPLLRRGGHLLAMKGDTADKEIAAAGPVLRRLRAEVVGIRLCGAELIDAPARVVDVVKLGR